MNIKFKGHESGFCRVVGKHGRKIFCVMEGYNNYGFMGLFACSADGEPSHQISNVHYTFDGLTKAEIESIPSRDADGKFGDRIVMALLNREHGEWI